MLTCPHFFWRVYCISEITIRMRVLPYPSYARLALPFVGALWKRASLSEPRFTKSRNQRYERRLAFPGYERRLAFHGIYRFTG